MNGAPLSVSVRAIADLVCRQRGIGRSEIFSQRRHMATAHARQIVMWLAYRHTGKSTPEIGRILGRDHTTVMHAMRAVDARRANDPAFAAEMARLSALVTGLTESFQLSGQPLPSDICAEATARRIVETPRGAIRVSVIEIEAMASAIVADLALRADVYRLLTAPDAEAGNAALDAIAAHFGAATEITDPAEETADHG